MSISMKLRSLGTHDGTFHADEVVACSLLLLFNCIDRDKVIRSRDPALLSQCEYLCDVGGIYDPACKRFDHHQIGYQEGLSSAGMVLLYLKQQGIIDHKIYDAFNRTLVSGVDAHDNGHAVVEQGVCTFSQVITNFVPFVYGATSEEIERAFFEAVDFTHGHLKRFLDRNRYIEQCRGEVEKAMKSRERVLVFDRSLPWMDLFFDMGGEKHPALFIIMPVGSHWKLRGIPPNLKERMKVRLPLPASWAGLIGQELENVSGVSGAIFCHKGKFISIWKSKEDAFQALKIVLNSVSR